MRASEFVIEPGTVLMGKLASTGQIVRIIKQVTGPAFAQDKSEVWSLIDMEPERRNKISNTKWVPADTAFEWVRPYLEKIDEISRDRLERYLDRANRQVDTRQERMARARQRLNTSYEIYHAETPNKVVDRFEADTPALAQKYYQDYIERYESDVDYDLRLRRGTGIMEGLYDANPATYDLPRRSLNVPELIKRGAIFITEPHGDNGWEPDAEGFSLITLYNVAKGGWPTEAKQHLKPSMYHAAATGLNRQGPGTMLYDGKYRQILWSIKKLGIPDEVAFLDEQLDEGLRDWIAALAATGAMALGTPAVAKQVPTTTSVSQQAYNQISQALATPAAQTLKKTAIKAGIVGTELAQFMAQCAHETANFTSLEEFGGSLDFRKYDPKYNPRKAKQLGNKVAGDGAKYKGRGFIQLTGRDNYKRAGQALGLPLEQRPELVERPDVAAKVAVWFWQNRVAPKVASFHDTQQATKPINPAMRGLSDRHTKFNAIKQGAMAQPKDMAPRGRRI